MVAAVGPAILHYVGRPVAGFDSPRHGYGPRGRFVGAGEPFSQNLTLHQSLKLRVLQFFLLPPTVKPDVLNEVRSPSISSRSLTFACTSIDDLNATDAEELDTEASAGTTILHDRFVAASENGCIVSRATEGKSERPWKSSIPGSLVGLQWV